MYVHGKGRKINAIKVAEHVKFTCDRIDDDSETLPRKLAMLNFSCIAGRLHMGWSHYLPLVEFPMPINFLGDI